MSQLMWREAPSYDPTLFGHVAAVEERHFWFRARRKAIEVLAGQIVAPLKPGYRVLEVGCGTGGVLRVLEECCRGGTVVGMDPFAEGLRQARRRAPSLLVQADIHDPPFGEPFDLIGVFDVLEHVPDDLAALRTLSRMLAPGGALLLTVPAHPSLWSYFDEASRHARRYLLGDVRERLELAGFEIEYLSHFMASIFPLLWLGRRLSALLDRRRRRSRSASGLARAELKIVPGLNPALAAILSQEARLIARRWRLPIGTSLVALARKPER